MAKGSHPAVDAGLHFSEKWWNELPDTYEDLMRKLEDPGYVVKCQPITDIPRAVLTCRHILGNLPKGSRILDMACGIGYVTHALVTLGYDGHAFDAAEKGIQRAQQISRKLGQDPGRFKVDDQSYLDSVPDRSFDAVIALGYFRYIDRKAQDRVYRHVRRILKPGGLFVLNHQNLLFEIFALNDEALKFWAETIEGLSPARSLLGGKSVLAALKAKLKVPVRKYAPRSASRVMPTVADNPLTYRQTVDTYGFKLEKILYPNPHLLPPFLENEVDEDALFALKQELFLKRAEDWRSMFMEYEFLAFLRNP